MLQSLLVLTVGILWSTLDVLRKFLAKHIEPTPLVLALTIGHIPIFIVWCLFYGEIEFHWSWFNIGIINVILSTFSFLMFIKSLQLSPISQVIPLLSFTPVFSSMIGFAFLEEILSLETISGMLLIILASAKLHEDFDIKELVKNSGSLLMMGVALIWATIIVLDKMCLAHASVPMHGLLMAVGIVVVLISLMIYNGEIAKIKSAYTNQLGLLSIATVTMAIAIGLQLWVVSQVPVGIVEGGKRGIGMIMAVLCGKVFFQEDITTNQIIAVTTMIIGVLLIVLN